MKSLLLSLLFGCCLLTAFSFRNNALPSNMSEEKIVTVTVTLPDGQMIERAYTAAEISNDADLVLAELDVVTCTYVLSTGDCSTTASTCAGAKAGMLACAKEIGAIK
jgi:hypothetical protein